MAPLNVAIHQWDDTYNKSKQSKIHRCLIQKTNIKKTLNEAANPTEDRAASSKDPNTGKLTCDTKRLTETFSDTLLTLGGPLNYEPGAHTAEEPLQRTPQCPPTTAITPTSEISWHRFTSYLHSCKPSKAGCRDCTNGYLFHISPEPVKRFLLSVCNLHLTNDMPNEWLEANVVLLYKKGPTHDPVNYRPIAPLNTQNCGHSRCQTPIRNFLVLWPDPQNPVRGPSQPPVLRPRFSAISQVSKLPGFIQPLHRFHQSFQQCASRVPV